MEKSARNHVIYFDIIRIVACFFVIIVHVSANQLYIYSTKTLDFQVSNFLNTLAISSPAIFFMLSGAIFLHPDFPEPSVKKLWGKYILRMALAYVFWSFLYTFLFWLPNYTFSLETVKGYVNEFFIGVPMYHMWFIPVIISIYMILPLLRPAFADEKRCKYYLILFFVVQFLIPTILKFDFSKKYVLQSVYSKVPYLLCIGHVGYFVLGYYLSIKEFNKKTRMIIYAAGILSTFIAAGIDGYLSICQGTPVLLLDDIFSLNSFFLTSAVFVAFRYISWNTEKIAKIVSRLSKLTFGIYLIHPLFLNLCFEYGSFLLKFPAVIWIPLIGIVTFLCSAAVIWLVSKIPIANKYLI